MKIFTIPINVRMRKETLEEIEYLLEKYPDKYSSLSHVIRCAVNSLINEEYREEENENRRIKNKSKG